MSRLACMAFADVTTHTRAVLLYRVPHVCESVGQRACPNSLACLTWIAQCEAHARCYLPLGLCASQLQQPRPLLWRYIVHYVYASMCAKGHVPTRCRDGARWYTVRSDARGGGEAPPDDEVSAEGDDIRRWEYAESIEDFELSQDWYRVRVVKVCSARTKRAKRPPFLQNFGQVHFDRGEPLTKLGTWPKFGGVKMAERKIACG
jgi:hypothetical protein